MKITDQEHFLLLQSLTNTFKKIQFWKPSFATLILSLQAVLLAHKSHKHSRGFFSPSSSVKENMPTQSLGRSLGK